MSLTEKIIGNRSLVQHMTFSLIAVVVASSIAISSIIFILLYQRSEAQFEQRSNEALSHLANSLESYLWHMEEESVISLCETFTRLDIVTYIQVTDHRGNEIFVYGEVKEGETIVKERTVSYDDIEVGRIRFGVTPEIFRKNVFETTYISLLALLSLVVVLGIFTKLILNRTLRTPLGQLISRIEAIAEGRYADREDSHSLLEIRQILSKFNEMAEQVHQRESELRVSEEKYRRLFETSIEGILVLDVDMRLTMVNQVLATMLGYSKTEMEGMSIDGILAHEDMVDYEMELARRRAGHSSQYERRLIRKDGSTLWAIVSFSPMMSMDGEYQGSFGMVTDITDLRTAQAELKLAYDEMEQRVIERTDELNKTNRLLTSEIHIRKQTEKDIIKAKEAAEEATKAKSEFLANMSHEIRTPMNAIIGMTHLVNMTELTATQKDYLNKIDISARSLLGIINDILDMSKIEAGMLSVESAGFKLDQVLEQLTTIVSPRANEKKLEFLINVDKNVPSSLVGDSMRLSQILINLCNNAVKFTEEGSVVVSIHVLQKSDVDVNLRFTVKDDGIGIKSEKIEELFQPFTQADASTTRKYGGTGLGLNLCNQLVELMGGDIGAESEFGVGSLFWFEINFPIHREGDDPMELPEELLGMPCLVTDDNPTSRIILKGMLEQMGLSVSLSKSGQETIEILRNTPVENAYQLLVLDWRMPGMDGLETASTILTDKTIEFKPPMFMVSAYGNATLVKKTTEMGFKGLLFKPVNQSFLFNLVVETLGKGMVTRRDSAQREATTKDLEGAKVLLAEDNEINRQVAQEILTSVGVEVVEVFNGQEAVNYLSNNKVDLVLMDIQMPVMDGHEATAHIRQMEGLEDLPIVAMTAHAMVADIEKSKSLGMDDHIAKPFDPDDLFAILHKWLKSKSGKSKQVEEAGATAGENGLLPAAMDGIDVDLGLRRARGNEKLYKSLLLLLDEKYADGADQIVKALDEGRRKDGVGLAHSIKGTSGMLGAMDLFESSSALEKALDSDKEDVTAELDKFRVDLELVIGSIAVLKELGSDETELQDGEESATEDLLAALGYLKDPLKRGQPVVCRKGAKNVKKFVWPAALRINVEQMLRSIAEYDFKKALAKLEEIESSLT